MNSTNPFFRNKSFTSNNEKVYDAEVIGAEQTMTVNGTINKSFIMLLLLVASALFTWSLENNLGLVFTIGGAIIGFILVLIATFKPQVSPYLAPGYAIFEGFFIGGISAIFNAKYDGIVSQAVVATFVTFVTCFALYKFHIVKVTEQFRAVVIGSTMAIATFYLISWLVSLFMPKFQPIHHGNSMMSIGISVFVIVIAAMNLFLDFDQIEKGVAQKHPKYMEWFGAMGLMITLVWLYIEFLRLLSKLSSRK